MLPNFLIGGTLAGGTSFLCACLSHHPDIYLPKKQRPEPNFFHYTWKYEKGLDYYQNTWFHEVGNQRAVGVRSSILLHSDLAAERMIKDLPPDTKLIFTLRNPIERAWANYRFTALEGLEPLSFADAIEAEAQRRKDATGIWTEVLPHAYVQRSRYAENLKKFITLFGPENILLIKSEELSRDPHHYLAETCRFLGVDDTIRLPLPESYSSPNVHDLAEQVAIRQYFGDRFPDFVEAIRARRDATEFLTQPDDAYYFERLKANLHDEKQALTPENRQRLHALLADDIKAVEQLVPFSVSDWK